MEDSPEEITFNILAYSNDIKNMLLVNKHITNMYKSYKTVFICNWNKISPCIQYFNTDG